MLSIFSRVFERIVQDQLYEFLKLNCILTKNQKLNPTIFSDSKILINKLMKYDIKGKEIEWFKSYLSGRKQFCTGNGHKSRIEEVTFGISSMIILRPFLFIVYLYNFESYFEFSKASMYADDTHTTTAFSDIAELIRMTNQELLNISN